MGRSVRRTVRNVTRPLRRATRMVTDPIKGLVGKASGGGGEVEYVDNSANKELINQLNGLTERYNKMQQDYNSLSSKYQNLNGNYANLNSQYSNLNNQYGDLSKQYDNTNTKLNQLAQTDIDKAKLSSDLDIQKTLDEANRADTMGVDINLMKQFGRQINPNASSADMDELLKQLIPRNLKG